MLISNTRQRGAGETTGKVKVSVGPRGVCFSIDHQTFTLRIEDDPDQPKMERYRWYAKQLRIAFKRLRPAK